MVKTRTKKSKEDKSSATTAKVPAAAQEDDGENRSESSPEDRRRKVPSTSATTDVTEPTGQAMVINESTATQPVVNVQYVAYIKGQTYDIAAAARTKEIVFNKELDSAIGPIADLKFRRGCIRVTCQSQVQLNRLLKWPELLGKPIVCTLPWTAPEKAIQKAREREQKPVKYNKVVITGVSDEWTEEEIKDEVNAVYCRRIKRRVDGALQNTTAVIIGYVDEPPQSVRLMYRNYRTRPYIADPVQCHNCLRYGHIQAKCRSATRCPRCAGQHKYVDCTVKDKAELARCAKCGQQHSSKYRGCAKYTEVKTVLRTAALNKLSYADALKKVKTDNKEQQTTQIRPIKTGETTTVMHMSASTVQQIKDDVLRETCAIMEESLRKLRADLRERMRIARGQNLKDLDFVLGHFANFGQSTIKV